ncbi:radical SAM family heme chaperone HemW [Oceaniglobus indicus]|uniref:radical SAM family heme chaperone HemW n=1 Tax=Oceaniglobus indicus TaxID=2047749 RepID=UPI000C195FC5|nr:radical SAM family heme chaperone HemW [Oceaniglobus indicus]
MHSASFWPAALTEDWRNAGFGLYVHWPFCQAKCPYCDFNSHVAAKVDQSQWRDAFVSEIEAHARLVPDRTLSTIFFGGGTPSLMDPEVVASVIDAARKAWPTANDMEISLEANPTSVEAGRFAGYKAAGVNRISMGIQALNDADLRALGRLHTAQEAQAAFDVSRDIFDRVSFDLIYGRQHQTLADWEAELNQALSMAVDHLSLYQLTIEAGTAFGARHARGLLHGLPDDDTGADFYALTQQLCEDAGMPAYEISNHARPGCESRHNLIYWRYGDYAGIGPGAHGRLTRDGVRQATENMAQPTAWIQAQAHNRTHMTWTPLDQAEQATEYLLMGLRVTDGISLRRYAELGHAPLSPARIAPLLADGFLTLDGDRLSATDQGRPLLNAVLRTLLAD